MEFHKKLQELRKQKGITQEELATKLSVSRTAISKWESGRGYPNIDSLKEISKFFSITIDQLLSGDELLTIAEEDTKQAKIHLQDVIFSLLDISALILFFLPVFAHRVQGTIQEVSLLSLCEISLYLRIGYYVVVACMAGFGILSFLLRNHPEISLLKHKHILSILLNTVSVLLFIISLQPYAATVMFVFLAIKVLMLLKWR